MHTKYQHGGDIYSNKVSIDYSANINPLGLPQGVKEELARCIEEPVCCVYPDSQCRDLVKALADYHKVTQDWILCGNGAGKLIQHIPRIKADVHLHDGYASFAIPRPQ